MARNPQARGTNPDEVARARRNRDIVDLYTTGLTQTDIAELYGIQQTVVSDIVRKNLKAYQNEAIQIRSEYTNKHLAELQVIRRNAWQAWEDSRKPTITIQNSVEEGNEAGKTTDSTKSVSTSGNPAFLQTILQVQQREARLLGLDAPIALTVAELEQLTDEELQALKRGEVLPVRQLLPIIEVEREQ